MQKSKIGGVKMRRALEVLYKNHDLELRTNKKHSAEDCVDRLDFMIRVLLNMVRNLKSSPNLKVKVWRSLGRAEQGRLDLVLDRCILPPELMAGGEIECDYEEEKIQNQKKRIQLKSNNRCFGAKAIVVCHPCLQCSAKFCLATRHQLLQHLRFQKRQLSRQSTQEIESQRGRQSMLRPCLQMFCSRLQATHQQQL